MEGDILACTQPLKLFWTYEYSKPFYDIDSHTGELKDIKQGFNRYRTKVCSPKVHHLEEKETGLWPVESDIIGDCKRVFDKWIFVPCGKCLGCRLDQSRVWANRLMTEFAYYDSKNCWFVTLTYRERLDGDSREIVPFVSYIDDEGQEKSVRTLRKSHAQKFIQDLRNYCRRHLDAPKVRYFLSGEYGSKTKRPHYHAILFGVPLNFDKLVPWSSTDKGFTLYRCPELEEIWTRGNVLVSAVSWSTCAYVARYTAKKLGKTDFLYDKLGIEKEFSLMSRRPGIGYQYLLDHPECIEEGCHLSLPDGGRNFSAPRYFKSFTFSNECDILHSEVQDRQQDYVNSVLNTSSFDSYVDFLDAQDDCLVEKMSRTSNDVL